MNKVKFSYVGQLGILLGLLVVGVLFAGIFQLIISSTIVPYQELLTDDGMKKLQDLYLLPENTTKAKLMQVGGTFLMLFIPTHLYAKICNAKPFSYLGFNKTINLNTISLIVMITFLGMLLSGALGELNRIIPIPKNWEISFKELEANYAKQVIAMATMKTFSEYLIGMLIIAILPAIFEEIFFRGGLQQLLTQWFKNPFWGIVVTSLLFSLIHFSYYGFLPRFFLGIMLGYMFYFTNNLWYSILAHFLNNGIAVTAMYWFTQTGRDMKKIMDYNFPLWVCIVILPMLLLFIKLKNTKYISENYFAKANKIVDFFD